ncbi:hypothetical protein GUM07_03805 [Listeria monocytogenes]|nr:hypothetical protein [Listeria monocytogenes]
MDKEKIVNLPAITIGMVGEPTAFFQATDFACSQNILILKNKRLNTATGLFLTTLINVWLRSIGFEYGRPLSLQRFLNGKIKVPNSNDTTLNWNYMEQYVVNIMKATNLPELEPIKSSSMKLDTVPWIPVQLGDLFIPKRGNSGPKNKLTQGETVLISARKADNGFDSMVNPPVNSTIYRDVLTVNNNGDGGAGIAYYHPYEFVATQDVTVLISKNEIGKLSKLYIAQAITNQRKNMNFGFGNKLNSKKLEKLQIMLPATDKGTPDWQFMEDYIRSIPNSNLI